MSEKKMIEESMIAYKKKSLREKKGVIEKREVIRVKPSPATKKMEKLNRIIRELFSDCEGDPRVQ